jgi:hypothetical protein
MRFSWATIVATSTQLHDTNESLLTGPPDGLPFWRFQPFRPDTPCSCLYDSFLGDQGSLTATNESCVFNLKFHDQGLPIRCPMLPRARKPIQPNRFFFFAVFCFFTLL